ncbi:uncharacterized protein F4812DRAFT_408916 [Daldinia caldariorum]|uniref:uncharacterized protein n=1 Tax=Daldinia caldariorum TaxID=326644 RepID=UPI002007E166|nr:uncharacterized protein F4812DRAFT_408916 [Daldinia caldariorum]KAI1472442.1 hypothetical protein F4812DRAFT_408916 [Daldinia caldariorum]
MIWSSLLVAFVVVAVIDGDSKAGIAWQVLEFVRPEPEARVVLPDMVDDDSSSGGGVNCPAKSYFFFSVSIDRCRIEGRASKY